MVFRPHIVELFARPTDSTSFRLVADEGTLPSYARDCTRFSTARLASISTVGVPTNTNIIIETVSSGCSSVSPEDPESHWAQPDRGLRAGEATFNVNHMTLHAITRWAIRSTGRLRTRVSRYPVRVLKSHVGRVLTREAKPEITRQAPR